MAGDHRAAETPTPSPVSPAAIATGAANENTDSRPVTNGATSQPSGMPHARRASPTATGSGPCATTVGTGSGSSAAATNWVSHFGQTTSRPRSAGPTRDGFRQRGQRTGWVMFS